MGFRMGIVGLPNVGKSTLFNALTRTAAAQAANFPFCTIEPNVGDVAVPDGRLDRLASIAKSAQIVPTRMTFVVNLVICLLVYFLGHLAPVIVRVTDEMSKKHPDNAAFGMVGFLGHLFDTILPALEFFSMGPAIIREAPLDLYTFTGYVFTVTGYALIYTTIALIVGLILFEDRDLA